MSPLIRLIVPVMKIVIADDSALWRDRIKSILIDINKVFVVGEAENGTDALKIIMEKEPDLAIIDIRMPEMNGIELLKKIRELKMNVKIIMLTNYPYPQYRKRCLEAGADYFLSKTEDFEQIETIVRDILLDKLQ
ncbi:MAG TPA: response regulator [Bacteroidales bacterium]|nr:response regulator [Bacteroidales bacterium]HCU18763.1 response regulator [Bacteroidales bacterium]